MGLCLSAALGAVAEPIELFRRGLEAVDRGQWTVAVDRFREAVAEDGQEAERRIFVSGVFSYPYLPHFYLGWALYKAGPENCEESLRELEISARQEVVELFSRQLKELRETQVACHGRLTPAAVAAAAQAIERASALLETHPSPLTDPALETERQGARADLNAARSAFAAGQESARVNDYRQAEKQAKSATERLAELDRRLARAAATNLDDAVRSADEAITAAERAEQALITLLAAPRWAAVRRTFPELTVPPAALGLLREAKEKVALRASVAELEEARQGAIAAMGQLEGMRALAGQRFASWSDREDLPTVAGAALAAPETELAPAPREQVGDTGSEARSAVLRRVAVARDLLSRVADDEGGELFEAQKSRLGALISAASLRDPPDVEGLGRRLAESTAALRLIAGVQAFLAAEPERCAELLEAGEYGDPRLAAEAYLFVSAARFALYRRGAEVDGELREQAAAAARQSQLHAPSRVPAEGPFSPGFRELFASAAPGSPR